MSDAPATALRVSGVSKHYGDVLAVDDVSLELSGHDVVALVGPSGCGKSTLLRMLAGLVSTETGSISIAGDVVDDGHRAVPPERRGVGLVFQEHALFPHLTVARNVAFGVRDGGAPARVAETLAMVGLDGYGNRFPHELSGGERQRVALARALAPRPRIMLLDEPFASLDPNLRARLREDVVAVLRATGTPAVVVTHDQADALAIGDRVAVMRAGRIVQEGTPDDVFHRPVDRFVAAFMGEADFVTAGDLRALGDRRADAVGEGRVVMIRPSDVCFVPSEAGTARVVGEEFRGSVWKYALALDSGGRVHAIQPYAGRTAPGTRVAVTLRAGHQLVEL
jgi:iron(III) transport system ATP-binding protein